MTDHEFEMAMGVLFNQMRVLCMLPLEDLARTVERAESVGFLFVPPADYQRGQQNLLVQKRLLRLTREMRDLLEEMK